MYTYIKHIYIYAYILCVILEYMLFMNYYDMFYVVAIIVYLQRNREIAKIRDLLGQRDRAVQDFYLSVSLSLSLYIYIYIYVCLSLSLSLSLSLPMYVCMYIYIYIYIYMYIYIYIYMYDFRGSHLSNTTCLTQVFLKSGECCSKLISRIRKQCRRTHIRPH